MSDLQAYIKNRRKKDPEFDKDFDKGFEEFKIGIILRQLREEAGLTQEELARKLNTKKSSISRLENHAEDIKLSTLKKAISVFGKSLKIEIV